MIRRRGPGRPRGAKSGSGLPKANYGNTPPRDSIAYIAWRGPRDVEEERLVRDYIDSMCELLRSARRNPDASDGVEIPVIRVQDIPPPDQDSDEFL